MTFIVQQYDGTPRPPSAIAIVRIDSHSPDVTAVDDQPLRVALEPPNRIHVEVLPGPHEVDVEVTEPEIGLRHVLPVRFLAEGGKVYRVEVLAVASSATGGAAAAGPRWDARAYEVDRGSDAKIAVAAPWPSASPRPPAPAPVSSAPGAPPPPIDLPEGTNAASPSTP